MAEIESLVKQLPEGFQVKWTGISYEERLSGNQAQCYTRCRFWLFSLYWLHEAAHEKRESKPR
ncbi:hypothetical protein P4S64_02655, partial [Vibrio sp. M60_M31a]